MTRAAYNLVAAFVFRFREGVPEFLVLRRAVAEELGGTWQAVYGGIRENETAWEAALRELREETGLSPVTFYQTDSVHTFYVAREDVVYHCPCFAAEVAEDAVVRLNPEHDTCEWLPPGLAMVRYHWPGQRRIVQEILSEIIGHGGAREQLRIRLP